MKKTGIDRFVKTLLRCSREALSPTRKSAFWLLKLMVPISLGVSLMQHFGILAWMAQYLNPLFVLTNRYSKETDLGEYEWNNIEIVENTSASTDLELQAKKGNKNAGIIGIIIGILMMLTILSADILDFLLGLFVLIHSIKYIEIIDKKALK